MPSAAPATGAIIGLPLLPWGLLALIAVTYALAVVILLVLGRRTDARALAGFVPDCIRLITRLARSPETSRPQRVGLLLLTGYLAFPIDLIPDFIPVVGILDDAILVAFALRRLLRSHGEAAIRAAWPGPEPSLAVVLRLAAASGPARSA